MGWIRLIARILGRGSLPTRSRLALLRIAVHHRLRPRPLYTLPVDRTSVFLTGDDFDIDLRTLAWVFLEDSYAGDYAGAMVLDIGAHKGYFGAYALARGAVAVVSYEPEAANYALLDRSAAAYRERDGRWRTKETAVGAEPGEATLHVLAGSWGHALHPPDAFAEYEVGVQHVPVAALAELLAEATAEAATAPVVVKINIEGEECATVLGTPVAAWEGVSEVFVETHPWADCGAAELRRHLEQAGFTQSRSSHPAVLRLRRG